MSYELVQHSLSIAATTLQAAAALVTLYGFFTTAMKRKSHPDQLDLFAPVQLTISPVVPTVASTPDPVVPTAESEDDWETIRAADVDALPDWHTADPWELPTEPAIVISPAPLHPPTPYLLLLPPAREVAAPSKRGRKPKAQAPAPALPTTVRELRSLCTKRGMKGAGRWTKAQCLEALIA